MPARVLYYDGCPTAHALDLIGERWALLIVRELLLGPKRFTDLMRGLPRVSRNVLTQRLNDLDDAGVLIHRRLPPPASASVYELTPYGLELEPVLKALGRWGAASASLPPRDEVGVDTFILGLRDAYDAESDAGPCPARYEVRVDADVFDFAFDSGHLTVRRGDPPASARVICVDPETIAAVASGTTSLVDALSPGPAEQDHSACRAFAGHFPDGGSRARRSRDILMTRPGPRH